MKRKTGMKRLAKKLAAALFDRPMIVGRPQRAVRLALMYACPAPRGEGIGGEHMGGGWCEAAVVNVLLEVMEREAKL